MKNLVIIGGGTGSFTVLTGLKTIDNVSISAIVDSTDSGGSTGRLRDEFGYLPVGDTRQCLVALAENSEEQKILRDLFSYRFDKGENGLKGHNFGNLFMTAVRDIVGDELKAIEYVQKLLNIKGNVYPVTLEDCHIVATYENGSTIEGESNIDSPAFPHDGRLRITNLTTNPRVQTHKAVTDAILEADYIIICPGDLYTSICANLVVEGVSEAIQLSKAKIIYISNLVTKLGQTYDFKLSDFINEMERYLTRKLDVILVNNKTLPNPVLKKYALESAYAVENDLNRDPRIVFADLLATQEIKTSKGDLIKRSLIRHDSEKIAQAISDIIKEST